MPLPRPLHPLLACLACLAWAAGALPALSRPAEGPVRVLFLGHEQKNHDSGAYYPMLAQALGREAIYFDYVTSPEEAFADPAWLDLFDAVLLYANHQTLDPPLWENLKAFIEQGGGFIPVHCASWCFQNIPEYDQVVGGRFASHRDAIFRPRAVAPEHPAIRDLDGFEAWDETYVHVNHNPAGRVVLQVRDPGENDNITAPEPWTWVREQGRGRVFYTASGHDERVWSLPEFHQLLRRGILWSIGDERRDAHERFLAGRVPLRHEPREGIPNYENRPEPLPWQHPLAPEDSLAYTRAPAGFRVELFAAEPDIVNPICLAWDEQGRLWVAETIDYPNEVRPDGGSDRLKILEDTTGDGRCDTVTVFAEGLNIPTSLAFWNGGVIVAQAPHFLYLKDENGDGRADTREIILSGWGTRDTHAGPSNLRYGFDNWFYGAVGYSGFEGEAGGRSHKFASGLYRFRPDGSAPEFLHQFNNNTWGLGFNASGDLFGSTANNNPSFHGILPASAWGQGQAGRSARMIADSPAIHPVTPAIRQVDAFGAYTSAAGHAFAASANFPPRYRDRAAFIAEPTGHLLGVFDLQHHGPGYRARNASAFLASADEWFSPVAAEIGPDGNLWVADWYNFIIQHNPTPTPERGGFAGVNGAGNAHENPLRDRQHGRIYRVIWDQARPPAITSLAGASPEELVAALSDDNLFWRLTAQRLLVASEDASPAPALRSAVREGGSAAIHALWALEGLGQIDRDTRQHALLAPDPDLKRAALRSLGDGPEDRELFFDSAVIADSHPAVRLAAFIQLARFPADDTTGRAARQLLARPENRDEEWLALALEAAGAGPGEARVARLGPNLLPNPSFEESRPEGQPAGWSVRTYRGEAEHAIDETIRREGGRSLRIRSREGADTSWHAQAEVKPGADYRLSGWARASGLEGARGAQLNVHEIQGESSARTEAVRGDSDWTELTVDFNAGERERVTVNLLFGGWGQSTGSAWWDDVALQEITWEDAPAASPVLAEGDADRGRGIFFQHQVAGCVRCHAVEGEGGPVGPPLDGIASRKDRDYLYRSLVDPGADLAEGFAAGVSPMPPMGLLLAPQELADLLAYLETLR